MKDFFRKKGKVFRACVLLLAMIQALSMTAAADVQHGSYGWLIVEKTVEVGVGETADLNEEFSFEVRVYDWDSTTPCTRTDNDYVGPNSGGGISSENPFGVVFDRGVANFTLKSGEQKKIRVSAGHRYEVTETDAKGYTVTYEGATGEIPYPTPNRTDEQEVTAHFTNSKEAEKPKEGSYKYVHEYYRDSVDPNNLVGTSSIESSGVLQLDDTITYNADNVEQVPKYNNEEYTYDSAAYGKMSGADQYGVEEAMASVVATENGEQIIILRYILKTGSLTVRKTVSGSEGDASKDWNFTVTLSNKTISGVYGEMEFQSGVASFTLKHDQSKTAWGIR